MAVAVSKHYRLTLGDPAKEDIETPANGIMCLIGFFLSYLPRKLDMLNNLCQPKVNSTQTTLVERKGQNEEGRKWMSKHLM